MISAKTLDLSEAIKSCQARLRNFIRKRVPRGEDADDILQEVFYQFAKANALLQPVENAAAWLFKAARNQIIDHGRKKKEFQLDEENSFSDSLDGEMGDLLLGGGKTPEEEYLRELFWMELENALAELPDEQRDIFMQTEINGATFKQLAEETGVGVNTLLSKKHRAVLFLRRRLQEMHDELIEF